jgi:putative restriction endonuclease
MSDNEYRAVKWSDGHLLIALNLYSKIPFGRFHERNPVLVEVAERMGRTPGSLAMKLCNFASLDPILCASGRKGLEGASRRDREMWEAFQSAPDEFGPKSEQLLHDLMTDDQAKDVEVVARGERLVTRSRPLAPPSGASEAMQWVRARRGQSFFRGSVLAAYDGACCITGIPDERLLEAAHIKSWTAAPEHRHNPRNGLCLSKLHHAAFDEGLITFDEDLRVVLSRELREHLPQESVRENFARFEGVAISRAVQNAEPAGEFLAWHREEKFLG